MVVAGRGSVLAFCRVDGRLFRNEPKSVDHILPSGLGYPTKRNVFSSVSPIFLHLTVKLACALPRYC
jgi:hypothetical protein